MIFIHHDALLGWEKRETCDRRPLNRQRTTDPCNQLQPSELQVVALWGSIHTQGVSLLSSELNLDRLQPVSPVQPLKAWWGRRLSGRHSIPELPG